LEVLSSWTLVEASFEMVDLEEEALENIHDQEVAQVVNPAEAFHLGAPVEEALVAYAQAPVARL